MPLDHGRRRTRYWLSAVASTIGCVSTDLELAPIDDICLDTSALVTPTAAIAYFDVPFTDVDWATCAAIAIAPRLLLTSLTCVAVPADIGRAVEADLTLDAALCTTPAGTPREDGSLATRFAGLVEPRSIQLYFPLNAAEARQSIIEIAVSGTSSGCTDNLALLVLDESLPVPHLALRLDDVTEAGEAVVVTDMDLIDGSFQPRTRPAHMGASVADGSEALRPPRSLTVEHAACDFVWGAGVFSEQTGALLGLIPPAAVGGCSVPDRPAVGVKLAAFRRMLLDTARDAEATTLRLEATPGNSGIQVQRCASNTP
jgi:hypothetical protein